MADIVRVRVLAGGWYWANRKMRYGDEVEAPARQAAAWQESGTVEVLEASASPAPGPEPARDSIDDAPDEGPDEGPEWPHKIPPEHYVNRFPEGPDADLARSLLDQSED